jgi:hypothetical protein
MLSPKQTQVGGKKNSVILQKLTPDSGEAKDISGQGKTSKWTWRQDLSNPQAYNRPENTHNIPPIDV